MQTRDRFLGCLLGGAVGDALGAPVEFMTRTGIRDRFGPAGITEYAPAYGGLGTITDDTQMTLFTAEGLLTAWVRECGRGLADYAAVVSSAYLRWLHTQGEWSDSCTTPAYEESSWLLQQHALHQRRAPGNTCLSALRRMTAPGLTASNDSKGCGGVMRIAPVGLFAARQGERMSLTDVFHLGRQLAALTHGHPTGSLTAGVLGVLIAALAEGAELCGALADSKMILKQERGHEETLRAIEHAQALAASSQSHEESINQLGRGWVAEEALGISLYCALVANDFRQGVILAVNHDGDSDSTGAIVGNLLGTMHGVAALPAAWLEPLELRGVISEMAEDLHDYVDWDIGRGSPTIGPYPKAWWKYLRQG